MIEMRDWVVSVRGTAPPERLDVRCPNCGLWGRFIGRVDTDGVCRYRCESSACVGTQETLEHWPYGDMEFE